MTVLQETKLVLGAGNNGSDTDALQLFQTATKVFVHFANGVAGTLTVKQGASEDMLITESVPDGSTYVDTLTESISFVIDGPGVLAFGCADIDGAITIVIEEVVV
jgi:hypothetical protein